MICTNCQKEIAENSNFCYFCGARQQTVPASQKPPMSERRLMRSAVDKKIAGVCAGFANYLDVDVTLMRLIWVLLTFFSGFFPGFFIYVIAWLVMPIAPVPLPSSSPSEQHP